MPATASNVSAALGRCCTWGLSSTSTRFASRARRRSFRGRARQARRSGAISVRTAARRSPGIRSGIRALSGWRSDALRTRTIRRRRCRSGSRPCIPGWDCRTAWTGTREPRGRHPRNRPEARLPERPGPLPERPGPPRAPLPSGLLVHLRGEELVARDLTLQYLLAVAPVRGLVAEVDARADQRVGVDVDEPVAVRALGEAVRRQRAQHGHALRRVRRAGDEAGGREQVLAVSDLLLRGGAGREGEQQDQ